MSNIRFFAEPEVSFFLARARAGVSLYMKLRRQDYLYYYPICRGR